MEYPSNLLEAFRDAKDFLLELQESKKDSPTELKIITYQYDFIERHLIEYVEKFNLLEGTTVVKENIWNDIFTNDKNVREEIKRKIKQKLSDFDDHYSILGEKYMERIKWFFKILYCVEPHFINVYFPSIAAYLTYLTLRIKDYVY